MNIAPGIVSDPADARAVKANLYDLIRLLAKSPLAQVRAETKWMHWTSAVVFHWANGVLAHTPADAGADAFVQQQIEHFVARGVPCFSWWLDHGVPREGWDEVLRANGLKYSDSTPGMVADLAALPPAVAHPAELVIRPVETLAEMEPWGRVLGAGFGLPPDQVKPCWELMASMGLDLPLRHYLGFLGDTPIATVTLFLGGGAAGIYNLVTLSEHRQRGIGAALTLAPLLAARDMGYRVGVLQASRLGLSMFERLGFVRLSPVDYYLWYRRA